MRDYNKPQKWECSVCGTDYWLTPDKPGKIDQCADCGRHRETESRVGGNMVWTGKQAPEIEIKPMAKAKAFASRTRRLGAGVTASIVQGKKKAESEMFSQGQWMSTEPLKGD